MDATGVVWPAQGCGSAMATGDPDRPYRHSMPQPAFCDLTGEHTCGKHSGHKSGQPPMGPGQVPATSIFAVARQSLHNTAPERVMMVLPRGRGRLALPDGLAHHAVGRAADFLTLAFVSPVQGKLYISTRRTTLCNQGILMAKSDVPRSGAIHLVQALLILPGTKHSSTSSGFLCMRNCLVLRRAVHPC